MAKSKETGKQALSYKLSTAGEPIVIKKSIPKNYEILEGTLTEPPGTRWIRKKGVPFFKQDKAGKIIGKNPQYKNCLVITDEDYFTTRIAEDRIYEPKKAANFTVDKSLEAKISAKEKRLRKELAQIKKEKENQGVNKTVKPAVTPPAKKRAGVPKPPKAKTYTVAGRTFATKAEAQAYKSLSKRKASKPCEIMEGTRKPTHKIVSFTAKNK